jgi:GntR family transcriptional regulator
MKASRLDKALPVPLYHQLKEVLSEKIRRGDWKPNTQLPTEDELCIQFSVSKATVRQALRDLAQLGQVRRIQGRGTFVADQKIQFGPRQLTSFTQEMGDIGLQSESRVLDQSVELADEDLAHRLNVDVGTPLFRLHRLRLAGGAPMGLQTVFLPCASAPDLWETNFTSTSLYETLETHYNLVPDHAVQEHYAVALEPAEALLLEVPAGSPALAGERLTYLQSGRPLEVTRSLMRADRYRIQLKLARRAGRSSLG